MDVILPMFFAFFCALGLAALLVAVVLLDPLWLLRMELQLRASLLALTWGLPQVRALWAILAAAAGLAVLAGLAISVLAAFWLRPRLTPTSPTARAASQQSA